MKSKLISVEEALSMIKDGDTLLIGGFLGIGSPHPVINALAESDKKDFTVVGNDTSYVDYGIGKLVVAKKCKKVITTHIGTNKESIRQKNAGETEFELVPQGSLAEKLRSGAYGIGGILTPTGVGTEVEVGKQVIELHGKKYILEEAIKGNVSLIYATRVDKAGNCDYHGSTRIFNVPMAGASDITIVVADEVVEIGELDRDNIKIPGVLIDYIIDGGSLC